MHTIEAFIKHDVLNALSRISIASLLLVEILFSFVDRVSSNFQVVISIKNIQKNHTLVGLYILIAFSEDEGKVKCLKNWDLNE